MIYRYMSFMLTILGMMIGLSGLCLDMILPLRFRWLLWIGITGALAICGFATGSLIQKLSVSSHTDFLTGLWNRRYFYGRLDEEEAKITRKKTPLCIAMIDMDGFKQVNDTYGHAVGDVLLVDMAAILRRNTRSTDVVARWGGDEFAILFSETSLANAQDVLERIRHKAEETFRAYQLTISAGIITLPPDQALKDLLIKADEALYKAKAQKNTVMTVQDICLTE